MLSKNILQSWKISASLFHGPPCCGKRTIAFETARYLLCIDRPAESCRCRSCLRPLGVHPDFICVGRNEKIKVDDVDSILEFISVSPFLSNRRVVIIDNAHNITWEAANRLLKVMEEPPDRVHFILVSSEPTRILRTIRSRCVQYQFCSLNQVDCINVLSQRMGFDLPKARVLGWIAYNSSVDVFSLAGSCLTSRDRAIDFLSMFKAKDALDALDFVDKIDRTELGLFIDMVILILTDIMILKEKAGEITNADARPVLEGYADKFNGKGLVTAASFISQAKRNAYLNINLSLAFKSAIMMAFPLMMVGAANDVQ